MFQNLRVNSTLYLLHRGSNPSLECGQVVNVSPIKTIYKTVPNMPYPQPVQVIDFVVNINGQNVNLQEIPANANIADDIKTGMLITGSRDEMNTEVLTMKQKSEDVLKSVEYHQNFLRVCDQMLAMLNPEFAAKQQQEQEISALKGQMSNMDKNMQEMSKNMADLIAQNQKLMEQLGVVEASKNKK